MTDARVLWEGDHYKAVVCEVGAERVKFRVRNARVFVPGGRHGWIPLFGERWSYFYGYRNPRCRWWFDRRSIHEGVMLAVQKAQQLERQHKETIRQTQQTEHQVEAAAEVHEIASEL